MRPGAWDSGGSNSFRVASIAGRTRSRNALNSVFIFRFEGDGARLSRTVLQEDFYSSLRLFELGVTKSRQLNALLKQFQRRIQRQLAVFQFLHDFFESFQRGFEVRSVRHAVDCS